MQEYKITFNAPWDPVYAIKGTSLHECVLRSGASLRTPCGGKGICGKCRVKVVSGNVEPSPECVRIFSRKEIEDGWRLACTCRISGACNIEVPFSSTLESDLQVLVGTKTRTDKTRSFKQDQDACYAAAVDIGTTTIAVSLLELNSGIHLGSRGTINPQVSFGDDVISRIQSVAESGTALEKMRRMLADACTKLISEIARTNGISAKDVRKVAVAGNTTMQCIFAGISVAKMGVIPFESPVKESLELSAAGTGLELHPDATVLFFPVLGAYVGGDITAGLLATGFEHRSGPILFVDVGTNGEIVLRKDGKCYAAAAAAGPAFEGARISSGMRASSGAVEKVIFRHNEVVYNVIGNIAPTGICGSALIDLVAEMLRAGLIDTSGRMLAPEECPESLPQAYKSRIENSGSAFRFTDNRINITQGDIRELQLASGAIRAATSILMDKAGISATDLDEILLAGGFGNYIRRSNAKVIGLIPDIPNEKIRYVGNTSVMGAEMALCSKEAFNEMENFAESIEYLEISTDPEFQMKFAESMLFPETDPQ